MKESGCAWMISARTGLLHYQVRYCPPALYNRAHRCALMSNFTDHFQCNQDV